MAHAVVPALLRLVVVLALCIAFVAIVERKVTPKRGRDAGGFSIRVCLTSAAFGSVSIVTGSFIVAALLVGLLAGALVLISNQKRRVLGEPLMFSDAWLLGTVLRYPRFYLSTIGRPVAYAIVVLLPIVAGLLGWLLWRLGGDLLPRGLGALLACVALAFLLGPVKHRVRAHQMAPALDQDMRRFGLFACLAIYGWRWAMDSRAARERSMRHDAPVAPRAAAAPDVPLLVVVQCESFADPSHLLGDPAAGTAALPALATARGRAVRHGRLQVSGFGAYTMRTEYGVLTGESEAALGFRRYDPYLDAVTAAPLGLPARLAASGFHSTFLHPHDLRFYNRHRLMPRFGFDTCVGPDAIAPEGIRHGPYVGDLVLAEELERQIAAVDGPSLLYAVTIENHGPWQAKRIDGATGTLDAYLRHLANSDRMLERLMAALDRRQGPSLLVFFGDHRPSIPGHVEPGGERHTPYVMLRFGAGHDAQAATRDLTPADLHQAILDETAAMMRAPARHAA